MVRTHYWTKPATASACAAAPLLSWFGQAVQSRTVVVLSLDGYWTAIIRASQGGVFDCRSAAVLTQSEWHSDSVTRLVGELYDNMYIPHRLTALLHCVRRLSRGPVSVACHPSRVSSRPPVTKRTTRRVRRRRLRRRLMDRSGPGGVVCGVFTAHRGQRRVTPRPRHFTSRPHQSVDVTSKSVR